MSYGASPLWHWHKAAIYIDKIQKFRNEIGIKVSSRLALDILKGILL